MGRARCADHKTQGAAASRLRACAIAASEASTPQTAPPTCRRGRAISSSATNSACAALTRSSRPAWPGRRESRASRHTCRRAKDVRQVAGRSAWRDLADAMRRGETCAETGQAVSQSRQLRSVSASLAVRDTRGNQARVAQGTQRTCARWR